MFRLFLMIFWLGDVEGRGLLLLYRPLDISLDCASSEHLRYDLTFGMGMSDTLTLVFRTLSETDYECVVEIGTSMGAPINLLIVIKYPNEIGINCYYNFDAFTIMLLNNTCLPLCQYVTSRERELQIISMSTYKKFQFRFLSNSSVNVDMNALQYEVTVTTARKVKTRPRACDAVNETLCIMNNDSFCFTSGVVCDGIKNCGVTDWFDERETDCQVNTEGVGVAPVVALAAALLCATLAGIHLLFKCLPPLANSFFIFNSNEDNRFCVVPMFKPPDPRLSEPEPTKRSSIIPVDYSSSESKVEEEQEVVEEAPEPDVTPQRQQFQVESHGSKTEMQPRRKTTIKYLKDKLMRTMGSTKLNK